MSVNRMYTQHLFRWKPRPSRVRRYVRRSFAETIFPSFFDLLNSSNSPPQDKKYMCHLSPPLLDKCKPSLHQQEEEDMVFACVVQVLTEHAQRAVAHFITVTARCQSCVTLCVPLIVSAAPINHFLPLFLLSGSSCRLPPHCPPFLIFYFPMLSFTES